MQGLYKAIGRIASAAHANGDEIDENIFPSGETGQHGIDIQYNGRYILFRSVPNEPRFTVGCPVSIAGLFRSRYTPDQLSERAGVDFQSLPAEEQNKIVESILRTDLEEASQYEDEFRTALQNEIDHSKLEMIRMTYGDDEFWNGILVRDRVFPYQESFVVAEYRDVVNKIYNRREQVAELLHQQVPPLNGEYEHKANKTVEAQPNPQPSGFQ